MVGETHLQTDVRHSHTATQPHKPKASRDRHKDFSLANYLNDSFHTNPVFSPSQMPPPHCHFTTRAPSLTTIEYKVSTASPSRTLSSQSLHYSSLFIRILLGGLALLAIAVRSGRGRAGLSLQLEFIKDVPLSRFGPVVAVVLFLVSRRYHTGEWFLPYHSSYFFPLSC